MEKADSCRNCRWCRASYKGGFCDEKKKRVKYTGSCEKHERKEGGR